MISIIVPVYNTQKYLRKCVLSVFSQTYKDFELILVNDCSTDQSLSLCKDFESKDRRVRVIDKKQNEGVDKARFSGLEEAIGESIFFLDSDDWLDDRALQLLNDRMTSCNCDIVVGGGKRYIGPFPISIGNTKQPEYVDTVICHDEFMQKYYLGYFGYNLFPVNIWGTLYKRSVIDAACVQPCGVSFGEDLVFNMKVMPFANKIAVIGDAIYNYRVEVGKKWKYENKWLKNARQVYRIKREHIKKYEVNEGHFFANIELINIVKTYINFAIDVRDVSRDKKISDLRSELEHSEYEFLRELLDTRYKAQDFVGMFLNKDAEGIFRYVEMAHNNIPVKQRIVRFIKSLF